MFLIFCTYQTPKKKKKNQLFFKVVSKHRIMRQVFKKYFMLKQRIINICGYSFEILYFLFKKKKKKPLNMFKEDNVTLYELIRANQLVKVQKDSVQGIYEQVLAKCIATVRQTLSLFFLSFYIGWGI